ncbi:MAG: tRNA (adenosine(37)-N6)-threonylcarbamoyltransferase complex dimerization subunit type 1 TsaB [Pyrinomonadaceae bacterium]
MSNLRSESSAGQPQTVSQGDPCAARTAVAPLILSLDTATAVRSVALVKGGRVLAHVQGGTQKEHASSVLAEIDEAFAEAGAKLRDIDLFTVTTGPGTFTGLRSGLATIKAFAATLNRQVVGVPTLHAIASAAGSSPSPVLASLPAGRGEVFAQLLSIEGERIVKELGEPAHMSPASLLEKAREVGGNLRWAGGGAQAHAGAIREFAQNHYLIWHDEANAEEFAPGSEPEKCWTLAPAVESYAEEVAALGLARYRAGHGMEAGELRASYVRLSDAELKERCLG